MNSKNDVQISEEPESREPEFSSLEEIPLLGSETSPSAIKVEAPTPNPESSDKEVSSSVEDVGPSIIDLTVPAPLQPLQKTYPRRECTPPIRYDGTYRR